MAGICGVSSPVLHCYWRKSFPSGWRVDASQVEGRRYRRKLVKQHQSVRLNSTTLYFSESSEELALNLCVGAAAWIKWMGWAPATQHVVGPYPTLLKWAPPISGTGVETALRKTIRRWLYQPCQQGLGSRLADQTRPPKSFVAPGMWPSKILLASDRFP